MSKVISVVVNCIHLEFAYMHNTCMHTLIIKSKIREQVLPIALKPKQTVIHAYRFILYSFEKFQMYNILGCKRWSML